MDRHPVERHREEAHHERGGEKENCVGAGRKTWAAFQEG
jgi:hypothetical protein